MKNFRFKKFVSVVTSFAMIASAFMYFPFYAKAATVTSFKDTVTRLGTAELANHTVLFTSPTGVASGATIILTFDNSTSIPGAWDFTDADVSFQTTPDGVCETGDTEVTLAAAPSGATAGIVDTSATVITFTNGTTVIAAGSEICFEIGTNADAVATGDQQITNGDAGNTTLVLSGTFGDSGTVTMPILGADLDQVVVSATVAPSLTFALGSNTVNLGALTAASTGTGTHTITTGTNATGGLAVTYSGATLTSGGDTITAIGGTPATSSQASEQFGINLADNATPNIGAAISGCTAESDYDTIDEFAFEAGSAAIALANSAGAPASCTMTVSYIANITSSTEAGSYSTTLTYIATGTF